MKCYVCGKEIDDNSLFCTYCGSKVEKLEEEKVESETENDVTEESTGKVVLEKIEEKVAEEDTGNASENFQQNVAAEISTVTGNKNINIIMIMIFVLTVIFLAAGGFFVVNSGILGGDNSRQTAFLKDGKVYYCADAKKNKEPMAVCDVKYTNGMNESFNSLKFSDDGKYLYFYSKVNQDNSGTLCRAELKASISEKNIDEIGSNVTVYNTFEDKNVVYLNAKGTLTYNNGKDEADISRDVENYDVKGGNSKIVYHKSVDGKYDVYCYDINSGNNEKFISDAVNFQVSSDENYYVYSKYDKTTEDYTIYTTDTDGNFEKIDTGVNNILAVTSKNNAVYYAKAVSSTGSVYDYVNDMYADADSSIKEPNKKDFMQSVKLSDVLDENDYGYYVLDYPEDLHYFYDYLSYDHDIGMKYYYRSTRNNFGNYNYEDFYYNEVTDEWFKFKEDSYNEACNKYNSITDRVKLREELKKMTMETDNYNIYYCKYKEKPVLMAENVDLVTFNIDENSGFAVYKKSTGEFEKISIDDIKSSYNAQTMIKEKLEKLKANDAFCYNFAGNEYLDDEIKYEESVYASVSDDMKRVAIVTDETLNLYDLTDKGISNKNKISADVYYGTSWNEGTLYYFRDVDESGNGDLYQYKDGKSDVILKGVNTNSAVLHPDGNITALNDFSYTSSNENEGNLRIFDGKDEYTEVEKSVTSYRYINSKAIFYLKNDNLYFYSGADEDKCIEKNIDYFICVEIDHKFLSLY